MARHRAPDSSVAVPIAPVCELRSRRLMENKPFANQPRSSRDWLTWLIVGLIAGVLASFLVGGIGYGLLGDVIVGIVGALIGGWLFGRMRWRTPIGGLGGMILVAFVGSVLLLLVLRLLSQAT